MVKVLAQSISILFHPLLMVTYGLLFFMWANRYAFGQLENNAFLLILLVFIYSFILPAIALFLMKKIELIDSLELRNREDRIIPLIVTAVFYCWLSINLFYNPGYPKGFILFTLAATLALLLSFIINLVTKISLHAIGIGGFVGFVVLTILFYSYDNLEMILLLSVVLAGVIGSSRLILKAHKLKEVYYGYLVGFGCQLIIFNFLY